MSLIAHLLHGNNYNFVRRVPTDWPWCAHSAWRYLIYLQIPRTPKTFPFRNSNEVMTKETAGKCAKWWEKDGWVLTALRFRAHCWVYQGRSRHRYGALERQQKLEVCPNGKRTTLEWKTLSAHLLVYVSWWCPMGNQVSVVMCYRSVCFH